MNGDLVTLDYIEHDIVRPEFRDPRVHFALNCSALSCPPLASVPYEGALLGGQLDTATIGYINDEMNNYLNGNTLYLSRIFSWFSEDFPEDLIGWLLMYAQGELKERLRRANEAEGGVRVKYLGYDWGLNDQVR